MAKKKKQNKTNLSMEEMRGLLNAAAGTQVAFDLNKTNPTEVKYWIPTGSTLLNSIICKGQIAGIPGCKISSLAGLQSTGKSYMATQIAANAQKMDMTVVYFDAESAISPTFLEACGVDLDNFLYVQAKSVEFVLEQIENILNLTSQRVLFIWDSLALTPTAAEKEGDFNPKADIAEVARIMSKGLKKLVIPIANNEASLLILNQLKDNITANHIEKMVNPYFTPGGKAPKYSYSLEMWLTRRTSKGAYIENDEGDYEGGEVKIEIKKSRFGTERRKCKFDIIWGEPPHIEDEKSWLEICKRHERTKQAGAYMSMDLTGNGDWTPNFFQSNWEEKMKNEDFRTAALEIVEDELIHKFAKKVAELGEEKASIDEEE